MGILSLTGSVKQARFKRGSNVGYTYRTIIFPEDETNTEDQVLKTKQTKAT